MGLAIRHTSRRQRLTGIRQRWQKVVLLAACVGLITALVVSGFEFVVINLLLPRVFDLPLTALVLCPALGLLLNFAILRYLPPGRSTPATSDAYIATFHDPQRRLQLRRLLPRVLGGAVTLGLGGAMGLEGPSLYSGAVIGSTLQRRFKSLFASDERNLLLVAGAAAGVAAIFKAPATGVIFSLEVPFRTDVARRALVPALVAAAVSYITFVSISGTEPLFAANGSPAFDLRDIGGAVLIGLLAGGLARAFAFMLQVAKSLPRRINPVLAVLIAGTVLAALALLTNHLFDSPLSVGPGYRAVQWAMDPRRAVGAVTTLFVLRAIATAATVGGGGTGGLFIPLVIQGTLLGRVVGNVIGVQSSSLFPMIGLAAFLGAGYRTPLAGIVFVAEASGRAAFVVPALIAAAVAELVIGAASVSPYQRSDRDAPLPGSMQQ
ncbi:MAG: chloride channel protein [Actinomycetota bacterium]|nr:chloride channel protein [Actinomycetota bacterium]